MRFSRPFSVSERHPQAPLETQAGPSPAGGPKWGAGEPGNTSSPEKAYEGLSISSAQNARPLTALILDLIGPAGEVKCMCQGVRACSSLWSPQSGAGKVTLEAIFCRELHKQPRLLIVSGSKADGENTHRW